MRLEGGADSATITINMSPAVHKDSVALTVSTGDSTGKQISDHLTILPSRIENSDPTGLTDDHYLWILDSDLGAGLPITQRICSLVEMLVPYTDRLVSLDRKFHRSINVVYLVGLGASGRFDPASWGIHFYEDTISQLARMELEVFFRITWIDERPS